MITKTRKNAKARKTFKRKAAKAKRIVNPRPMSMKRAEMFRNMELDAANFHRQYATENITVVVYDSNSQMLTMAGPGDVDFKK